MFLRVFRSFVAALTSVSADDKIKFSNQLYLRVSKTEFTLISLAIDNIQSMEVPINEAREMFCLIKSACDDYAVREGKVGDALWTVDCLSRKDRAEAIMKISGGSFGFSYNIVSLTDVLTAVAEFEKRFGVN